MWYVEPAAQEQLDGRTLEARTRWSSIEEAPPRLIFHYTDAPGLLGILDSWRLWATHARYLNDFSELTHAGQVLRDVLESKVGDIDHPGARAFLTRAEYICEPRDGPLETFVACFCEHDDLLSQWRGYGAAGGYALGFDTRTWRDFARVPLRKVIYDRAQQEAVFESIIDACCDVLTEAANAEGVIPDCCQYLANAFDSYAPCFKHETFQEEREWRAVVQVVAADRPGLLRFRPGAAGALPFIEIALPAELPVLTRVRCGPSMHPVETSAALQLMRGADRHLAHCEIVPSDVPLRVSAL